MSFINLFVHRNAGFDPNLWWVDLRWLPVGIAQVLVGIFAVLLLVFAVRPHASPWRRKLTQALVGFFFGVALLNSARFWQLLLAGRLQTAQPVPLTLLLALALAGLFVALRLAAAPKASGGWSRVVGTAAVMVVLFPVGQVFCLGKMDYRRPADVAVVFGARVYADGRLSDAVGDRVRTACELYTGGWVDRLILSGGPGDGPIHETEAMKQVAMRLGVPENAITLDPLGLNTAATVRNTLPLVARQRVLVVSEFYHLPRIKLAYAQAGQEVCTVPAEPLHWLRQWPLKSIVREVPAFWAYWLRAGNKSGKV